ncbi:KamA family radical SAM protein [Gammaproteobacteria bacterium]|nr:KamA family radical SAM protein [Gammaproteobacteria bacterium]
MSKTIWQKELQQSITSVKKLTDLLEVTLPFEVNEHFPIKVTPLYASLIEKSNPHDPLLLQIVCPKAPPKPFFHESPLKEEDFSSVPGLIHKYPSRVLLLISTHCFIHCQYCFRQHFPYQEHQISPVHWQNIQSYIQNDPSIDEVILSGGDPFSLGTPYLKKVMADIEKIKHIKTIRFHTRILSVLPGRADEALINALTSTRLNIVIVTHINHANELCDENQQAFSRLSQVATLLNQSVLLKHINDNPQTLAALSHKLFSHHIMPYYLHHMDPVKHAEFYHINLDDSLHIVNVLKTRLSGYLMPKFVQEQPGKLSKTVIT